MSSMWYSRRGLKSSSTPSQWKSLDYFFSLRCWKMFVIMDAGLSWHRRLYVLFVSFCIMFVHATNCISDVPMDVQYHEIYAIVRSRILHINKHHIHIYIYIYIYNDYGIYIFIDVWKPHIAQSLSSQMWPTGIRSRSSTKRWFLNWLPSDNEQLGVSGNGAFALL